MLAIPELLRSYANGLRSATAAQSVSLLVPPTHGGGSEMLLIHDGEGEPLPELSDEAAANELLASGLDLTPIVSRVEEFRFRESRAAGGVLVVLPLRSGGPGDDAEGTARDGVDRPSRRRLDKPAADGGSAAVAWLGLRFADSAESRSVGGVSFPRGLTAGEGTSLWEGLLLIGAALVVHSAQVGNVFRDRVTGLPNRSRFQIVLDEEIAQVRRESSTLALLMVNPDGFGAINERFGREAGDKVVAEISSRLRSALRSSDTLTRYGGVIFAVTLVDISLDAATKLAVKVRRRLAEGAYLEGAVRLGFSIGIAMFEPDDEELRSPLDLIRRADQALNLAKRQGGDRVAEWEGGVGLEESGNFDRLSGIFTGNMSKDYRNMVLLSDALGVISQHRELEALGAEVVEKLYQSFQPESVGLFVLAQDESLDLVRGVTRLQVAEGGQQSRVETLEPSDEIRGLMREAMASAKPCSGPDASRTVAVPLQASDRAIGCIVLVGRDGALPLERSDLIFLQALAAQVAVALDRARLAELERGRRELERRELRAELNELRNAVQQSRLVYRSSEMDALVARARRVAPTPATVLILGESGTGKELLARTVHELSPRRKTPLVVVDCGSISSTLIESELFGHEKGAFTGAAQRRVGRLADAADGTVLLDEIGELPLEVQAKLLRFVQEKQLTTVGGTRPTKVDVRILVATHRDLATEVEAGRFREDLYYRLNVVRLDVPPLRERTEDVLYLARHFLESYVIQYQKNVKLSAAAERALLEHSWPGNVRELQNHMMQAVILCEGDEIWPEDLSLVDVAPALAGDIEGDIRVPPAQSSPQAVFRVVETTIKSADGGAWSELRRALRRQVAAVAEVGASNALPLGRWASEDLVVAAEEAETGNSRRAAVRLGIPVTTFRRRLRKAGENATAGMDSRADGWSEVKSALRRIVVEPLGSGDSQSNLLARVDRELLLEILEQFPEDRQTGAVLLGVSPPTFRRRVSAAEASLAGSIR